MSWGDKLSRRRLPPDKRFHFTEVKAASLFLLHVVLRTQTMDYPVKRCPAGCKRGTIKLKVKPVYSHTMHFCCNNPLSTWKKSWKFWTDGEGFFFSPFSSQVIDNYWIFSSDSHFSHINFVNLLQTSQVWVWDFGRSEKTECEIYVLVLATLLKNFHESTQLEAFGCFNVASSTFLCQTSETACLLDDCLQSQHTKSHLLMRLIRSSLDFKVAPVMTGSSASKRAVSTRHCLNWHICLLNWFKKQSWKWFFLCLNYFKRCSNIGCSFTYWYKVWMDLSGLMFFFVVVLHMAVTYWE